MGNDTTANIRALLARRKMTNADLARLIDENPMWVSRRLNDQVPLTVADLLRFADALGEPPSVLLPLKASA